MCTDETEKRIEWAIHAYNSVKKIRIWLNHECARSPIHIKIVCKNQLFFFFALLRSGTYQTIVSLKLLQYIVFKTNEQSLLN